MKTDVFLFLNKMVKHTQTILQQQHTETICRQFADELFECVTILWGWRLQG